MSKGSSKQGSSKTSSQQLSLDFKPPKAAPALPAQPSRVTSFVDSATLIIRQQAIKRVKAAGIFPPPKVK
jgi:hypothetical protein